MGMTTAVRGSLIVLVAIAILVVPARVDADFFKYPWQCGNAYVPWNQLSGGMGGLLYSRNLCGPRKAGPVKISNPSGIEVAYRAGQGRCLAVNTNPAIAGNPYFILAKAALGYWDALKFCQGTRPWFYVQYY